MQKSAGANYKAVDFLSASNMTWTSMPPKNEGLKRMGVKDRNFPKQIGSAVIAGSSTVAGIGGSSVIMGGVSALFQMEGGA